MTDGAQQPDIAAIATNAGRRMTTLTPEEARTVAFVIIGSGAMVFIAATVLTLAFIKQEIHHLRASQDAGGQRGEAGGAFDA